MYTSVRIYIYNNIYTILNLSPYAYILIRFIFIFILLCFVLLSYMYDMLIVYITFNGVIFIANQFLVFHCKKAHTNESEHFERVQFFFLLSENFQSISYIKIDMMLNMIFILLCIIIHIFWKFI